MINHGGRILKNGLEVVDEWLDWLKRNQFEWEKFVQKDKKSGNI